MQLLSPDFGLIFWTVIIFLLVLFVLRKFAWTPILKTLDDREKSIADSIESAERIKAEMSQMKSEHESVLAEAKAERSKILKEAKEVKDQIISEEKNQAKLEAKKIIEEAQVAINNQKLAALTEVKNQVGNLVIEISEKVLRRQLADQPSQEQYIRKLMEEARLN